MATKKYDESSIQSLTIEEHIRKRPGMYVGSLDHIGITNLLEWFCSSAYEVRQITEMKIILEGSTISILVKGILSKQFTEMHRWQNAIFEDLLFVPCIKILSTIFEIHEQEGWTHVRFKPDPEIWNKDYIPFDYLAKRFYDFAICRKSAQIILRDEREAVPQQLYYHFPKGLLTVAERWKIDMATNDEIFYLDESIGKNRYEIALFQGKKAQIHDQLLHFASKKKMREIGSLMNGILEGIRDALKIAGKSNFEGEFHVTKGKIVNQLWAVTQVECPHLVYAGSTRSKLDMPEIRKEARELIKQKFIVYLHTNPTQAQRWLQVYEKNHVV